jgi:hypothetical protein
VSAAALSTLDDREASVVKYESFYSTAATVMPVIFIFLLIEVRFLTPPVRPETGLFTGLGKRVDRAVRVVASILVIQIGYTEYACMAALATRHDNATTRSLTMVNIFTLSAALVLAALPFVWRRTHGWSWNLDTGDQSGDSG